MVEKFVAWSHVILKRIYGIFFQTRAHLPNAINQGNSAANYAYFIPWAGCGNFKERKALFTSDPGNRKTWTGKHVV